MKINRTTYLVTFRKKDVRYGKYVVLKKLDKKLRAQTEQYHFPCNNIAHQVRQKKKHKPHT